MTTAVIFDLDGLLVDTEIISYRIYETLLSAFCIPFSLEEYAETYSGVTEVKNAETLIARYRLPLTLDELLARSAALEKEHLSDNVALKAGAKELLAYLKAQGFRIALASSSTRERATALLEQHGILHYFDDLTFGYEVEHGKPAPDVFLKACEKLSVAPENALVLEDSEAGIQAAHAANIPVICIPDLRRPAQPYAEMTAAILPSLNEVIGYLENRK